MSLPTTFFIGRGGGPLTAAQIAAAALAGDTTVFQDDDNLATISVDEAAMEQIIPNVTAFEGFLNNMLVQRFASTGVEFYSAGTAQTPDALSYGNSIYAKSGGTEVLNNFAGGGPVRGFRAYRQNNTAPDAAIYVFKNFMPQYSTLTYYHEGMNGWDNGNTPHFAGFATNTFSGSVFQNAQQVYNTAWAYSYNRTYNFEYQGYYYSSGFGNGDNQQANRGYTFAISTPSPQTYPYFYIGVQADDGSSAGRSHQSHIAPLYAAKNNFT